MAKSTCAACKHIFYSLSGFDMHRVGSYEPPTRHCLSPNEMAAKGMEQNNEGVWSTGHYQYDRKEAEPV